MSETIPRLRATIPTLLDLRMSYRFDLPLLALDAGVDASTVLAMLNSLPISKDDAEKVLCSLSTIIHKDLSLENVHVVLKTAINKSELALLMQQIDAEYDSAQQGLNGLAEGTAQHAFITGRMEHIADTFQQIRAQHGDEMVRQIMQQWDDQEGVQAVNS